MTYRIQGAYRANPPKELEYFRNPEKKIEIETFIMEFEDYVPREEAMRVVAERARELSEYAERRKNEKNYKH